MNDPMNEMLLSMLGAEQLRIARRSNKIAAIVTDTCRERFEVLADERGDTVIPVQVVQEVLAAILAALAGVTDWEQLGVIHPDVTPTAYARLQALLSEDR